MEAEQKRINELLGISEKGWAIHGARFQNSQVAEIVGLTQRQVISWTEKGVIEPQIEARGAGTKRRYTYVNLLEFGLAKHLLVLGFGIQVVKLFLFKLSRSRVLGQNAFDAWAEDFPNYWELRNQQGLEQQWEGAGEKATRDLQEAAAAHKPEGPTGVLFWFFDMGKFMEKEEFLIVPCEPDSAFRLVHIKERLEKSTSVLMVNMGQIKKEIDSRL